MLINTLTYLTGANPTAQGNLRAHGFRDRFQAGEHGLAAADHDRERAANGCTPRASDRRIGEVDAVGLKCGCQLMH